MVKSKTWQFIHLLLHKPRAHTSSHALFKHLVYGPAHYESFVAQWLEHPTGVRNVEGSILVRDSDFSFFDMLITWTSLLISSPILKFTIFLYPYHVEIQ